MTKHIDKFKLNKKHCYFIAWSVEIIQKTKIQMLQEQKTED